jgi:NAD(P)-dependent dehydrogenase (short-subunit alcohol dehydrogenase family)
MERTILVTDGDTTLGSELVRLFSDRGYRVATTSSPEGQAPSRPLPKSALVVPWNRRSPVSAATLLGSARNGLTSIDEALILDVPRVSTAPIHELSAADIEKAFDFHLKPAVFLARELVSHFLERESGVLGLVSFSSRSQDGFVPALERAIRDGFKGFASSLLASYSKPAFFMNAFQSYSATAEDFALFIDKTLEEKGRKISGRWFTFQPKGGLFQGRRA